MKAKILLFMISLTFFMSSCKKNLEDKFNEINKNATAKAKKTTELKVNDNFNWQTSKIYKLKLVAKDNYPAVIYTAEGTLLAKLMILGGQENNISITLPAGQKQVRVIYLDKEYSIDLTQEITSVQL